jgi:ankyrin repeat protein
MISIELNKAIQDGNTALVCSLLEGDLSRNEKFHINNPDAKGVTPLEHAVCSPNANSDLVQKLINFGADATLQGVAVGGVLSGDPDILRVLLKAGADVRYQREGGYDALIDAAIDAAYSRSVRSNPKLLQHLKLLVEQGVSLTGETEHSETGVGVLSHAGRYDAAQFLLDAGARPDHVRWTRLIYAVGAGTLDDVNAVLRSGVDLEEKDHLERTAWIIALQIGDIEKAKLLLDFGANRNAVGRCDQPGMFYAIDNFQNDTLKWLLEIGVVTQQTDKFGTTALICAVENDNAGAVAILLEAGVNVNEEHAGAPISHATSLEIVAQLLGAGADPQEITNEGRRLLLGMDADPNIDLLNVTNTDFERGRNRRFGTSNPERIIEPFWEAMIRSGVNAYKARNVYGVKFDGVPIWCARRFGQSISFLPDNRIVLVAGEHEDRYDPDFCIYNDVIVFNLNGEIAIYEYPEADFPPTDFHTATLVGHYIYLIGSAGYPGQQRKAGETPVYRLDTQTFRIERLAVSGQGPGWIYRHRAALSGADEIKITGGIVESEKDGKEDYIDNLRTYLLNISSATWHLYECRAYFLE